jgi:hypothetical protein
MINSNSLKMKKLGKYVLVFVMFIGCTSAKENIESSIPTIIVAPTNKITSLNDSIYLGQVIDIMEYDDTIYLSEYNRNRIIVTDREFNFIKTIGSTGKGPGEFNGARSCQIVDERLYGLDIMNRRLNIFDRSGQYIDEITTEVPSNQSFVITKNRIYGASQRSEEFPAYISDLNGKLIKRFGKIERYFPTINSRHHRRFFLEMTTDEKILAVCSDEPVIEWYDLEGNFLKDYSLIDIQPIREFFQYVQKMQRSDEGKRLHCMFIAESLVQNSRLYLLLVSFDESQYEEGKSNGRFCSDILELEIEDVEINPVRIISLMNENSKTFYYAFTKSQERFICYDIIRYEIHEYAL